MKFEVVIEDCDQRFVCSDQQNLLRGMEMLGKRGIPVGCRGGGCGVCKVFVTKGCYRTDRMSRACVTAAEESNGVALACRLYPETDLRIRVVGKMQKLINRTIGASNAARKNEPGPA